MWVFYGQLNAIVLGRLPPLWLAEHINAGVSPAARDVPFSHLRVSGLLSAFPVGQREPPGQGFLVPIDPNLAHPHSFRHTYGRNSVLKGVPIPALQKWLGHQSLKDTQPYVELASAHHEWVARS